MSTPFSPFDYHDAFPPKVPPPAQFLADVYRHLPFLVVHLSNDGIVLNCNPATAITTGYEEMELIGRNFWGTLFPGKLFAQVPRFISPTAPNPLLHDTPMTIRTRNGHERTIAFTRFVHAPSSPADPTDTGLRTMVCIGVDLTDRLLQSDLPFKQNFADAETLPFGTCVGNGGAIDGDVVTPIEISPPSPLSGLAAGEFGDTAASAEAIRQVHEFITQIDARMEALQASLEKGEMSALASLADNLHAGARACGLLEFSARARRLEQAAALLEIAPVESLIGEMLDLYQPHRR